jgi:hypothetical protein
MAKSRLYEDRHEIVGMKECPWCYETEDFDIERGGMLCKPYAMLCNTCFSNGPPASTPEGAMEAWNERASVSEATYLIYEDGGKRARDALARTHNEEYREGDLEAFVGCAPGIKRDALAGTHEEETRCTWTYNDGYDLDYWETSCGEEFCFHNDGSLEDNKTVYCSFCGKRVLEKREDEQETSCPTKGHAIEVCKDCGYWRCRCVQESPCENHDEEETYRKCQVCRQDYPAPPDCTGLVCFHCMSSDTES